MKSNFITSIIILIMATFIFADQKPLDISKPYKMKPRGIIQKPIDKINPQRFIPQKARHVRSERVIKPEHQRSDHCEDGYVDDCSGDGDCCPESWIGDGFGDCEDQIYGCDLTCYDCDGGDCPETDPGCSGEDPYCGDGWCNTDETYENYPEDCEEEDYNNCDSCWNSGYGPECCDTLWYEFGVTCYELETNYYWDCEGCACPGDGLSECGDGACTQDETPDNCPEDCDGSCDEGYVLDYADSDWDCCLESWIGDEWADCTDQAYGCDLPCYDCDGGDCPETDPGCEETDDCCSPGDFNCDYSINVLDIISIVDCILNDTDCPCGDLNGDGSVNVLDIVQLVNLSLGNN